ncbi:MAG: hypothetical protein VXV96_16980 [Bdellovibrionota bacterium]|nr:hypothetical protein [Bdellovibrionota bacterium]
MKKTFLFFALALIPLAQSKAQNFRWDLQVTNPDYELVNYKLDAKEFKPYLKKTSWRCSTGETEQRGNISLKKLTCDYSIEKAGTVTTAVSCSKERPYSENYLELYDERKDLTFQVMLKCQLDK